MATNIQKLMQVFCFVGALSSGLSAASFHAWAQDEREAFSNDEALVLALGSADPRQRQAALAAIDAQGGLEALSVFSTLHDMVASSEGDLALRAALALAFLGDDTGAELILTASEEASSYQRRHFINALAHLAGTPEVFDYLLDLLGSGYYPAQMVRLALLSQAAVAGGPVVEVLEMVPEEVQAELIEIIEQWARSDRLSVSHVDQVLPVLRALFASGHTNADILTIHALLDYEGSFEWLSDCAADSTLPEYVQEQAVREIGSRRSPAAMFVLLDLVETTSFSEEVRAAAAHALIFYSDPEVVEAMMRWLYDGHERVERTAHSYLEQYQHRDDVLSAQATDELTAYHITHLSSGGDKSDVAARWLASRGVEAAIEPMLTVLSQGYDQAVVDALVQLEVHRAADILVGEFPTDEDLVHGRLGHFHSVAKALAELRTGASLAALQDFVARDYSWLPAAIGEEYDYTARRYPRMFEDMLRNRQHELAYARGSALYALGRGQHLPAFDLAWAALDASNFRERFLAVWALGEFGLPEAAPALQALFAEETSDHVHRVPTGDGSYVERTIKQQILMALAQIVAPGTDSWIQEAYATDDPNLRTYAIIALGYFSNGDVDFLAAALHDADQGVRRAAARSLAQLGNAAGVDALINAYDAEADYVHPNPHLARYAIWWARHDYLDALGVIGSEEALDFLHQVATTEGTPANAVMRNCVQGLVRHGDRRAVALIERALAEIDAAELTKVIAAAEEMPSPSYIDEIISILSAPLRSLYHGEAHATYVAAIRLLASLGAHQAVAVLAEVVEHAEMTLKREAITALGQIRGTEAYEVLQQALTHPDGSVRYAAQVALDRFEEDASAREADL